MASPLAIPVPFNYKTSPLVVHEELLFKQLGALFPNDRINRSVRETAKIKFPTTGSFMEFDIWMPQHDLCFEFQDAYHYISTWYYQMSQESIHRRDSIKFNIAHKMQKTLILVPCWWNGSKEALAGTIMFARPDLKVGVDEVPISANPPLDYFTLPLIPDVGELMLASFPQYNLSEYEEFKWWMGEKYDGIRCCWHASKRKAYTRFGKEVPLLPALALLLPPLFIDSEIWFGRGQFTKTFTLIHDPNCNWPGLRMISFDVPSHNVRKLSYEKRYAKLVKSVHFSHPFNVVVPRARCEFKEIGWFIREIIEDGGEGIILQRSGSYYIQGRSPALLKLKSTQADQEGIVVGSNENSVTLQLPSGTEFTVKATEVHIPIPRVGEIVTFSYDTMARRDVPTNPRIYRVRKDISWEEVVQNYLREKKSLHVISQDSGFALKEKGYWTRENMRAYMEEFALSRHLDPLQLSTWKDSAKAFLQSKSGRIIARKFKRGYSQAVRILFPEITFDTHSFHNAYYEVENRRKFFENYANKKGFDPLKPQNWYIQPRINMLAAQGSNSVLMYHNNSLSKALVDLFPNIGLDRSKFLFSQKIWDDVENRRKFFENYAESQGFDPLLPDNWYSQPIYNIMSVKGAGRVVGYHNSSIAKALADLFPDIGVDKSKFMYQQNYWNTSQNRRKLFETYASENNFDPLEASNWYLQPRDKLLSFPEATKVICYHRNSVSGALIELFPEIGLDRTLFLFHQSYWTSEDNRRKFFIDYAQKIGFDPLVPTNWYAQRNEDIMAFPGAWRVIIHHENSISTALLDLFPKIGFDRPTYLRSQKQYNQKKHREFFENFAKANKFDPLVPGNWYLQSKAAVLNFQGAKRVLANYSSISKALVTLFPDIGLDPLLLPFHQETYAKSSKRKLFFEKYARDNSFDPYLPHNWYLQSKEKILSTKGAKKVLAYHGNSISKALLELFPDIGLDKFKLFAQSNNFWNKPENQRKFFEKFAEKNSFDPLLPINWYNQSYEAIMSAKGAAKVMSYHNQSITKALLTLFPDIGLDRSKLPARQSLWEKTDARHKFFENYAKEHGFDPLKPENWYKQSRDKILSTKGAHKVISYHGISISKALLDLFPQIGLDKSKLAFRPSIWNSVEKRRNFFEEYAKENKFDPLNPANWYLHSKDKIILTKGAWGVISYHHNSVAQALLDLFPDIGLDKSALLFPHMDLGKPENRRKFLENFARANGFDPLIPSEWTSEFQSKILAVKGIRKVLSFHSNSLSKALLDIFPDMQTDRTKYLFKKTRNLDNPENRRMFFEKYAKENGFDPLNPENWYHQQKAKIMNTKGAWTVICYHNRSTSKALLDLFPEIGLDSSKLRLRT